MAELADTEILEEREALLLERRQEIADAAADIRRFTNAGSRQEFYLAGIRYRACGKRMVS